MKDIQLVGPQAHLFSKLEIAREDPCLPAGTLSLEPVT